MVAAAVVVVVEELLDGTGLDEVTVDEVDELAEVAVPALTDEIADTALMDEVDAPALLADVVIPVLMDEVAVPTLVDGATVPVLLTVPAVMDEAVAVPVLVVDLTGREAEVEGGAVKVFRVSV